MKRPTMLLELLFDEIELQFKLSVTRDRATLAARSEHEGYSFVTITMPTLCDALDKGLSSGCFTCPQSFKKERKHGTLPAFMQGLFKRVFDSVTGCLVQHPCIEAIRLLRQILRLHKKETRKCSDARTKRAYERYVENDQTNVYGRDRLPRDLRSLRTVAGHLWADLEKLSGELYGYPGQPGSGATAERLSPNQRYDVLQWPERGESHFPSSVHCAHNEGSVDSFIGIDYLVPDQEQPARVVTVPKTLTTPRIICVEPNYMMIRQQSVLKWLTPIIEHKLPLTRNVRFTDQTVNRRLAKQGSIDGKLSTLDLKDASDLVSNDLVQAIFEPVCPTFHEFLQLSRTSRSMLPDGTTILLRKFASMGSGTCFPVEAMVFFTIAVHSALRRRYHVSRWTRKRVEQVASSIHVYGDDIICFTEDANAIIDGLHTFGMKVNEDKSFTQGLFRESCGGDYFAGHDVTPCYVRAPLDSCSKRDAASIASLTSLQNQLYEKGYWLACRGLRNLLRDLLGFTPPTSVKDVGGVYLKSHFLSTAHKWDENLSRYSIQTLIFDTPLSDDSVRTIAGGLWLSSHRNGWSRECRGSATASDISQSTRPYALKLKRRWTEGPSPSYTW